MGMNDWCYFQVGEYKVKIDAEDLSRVSDVTWRVRVRKDTNKLAVITAVRTPKGPRNVTLGQFLMDPPKGKFVYPRRYQDGLDFRKDNLIVCSLKERQRMIPRDKEKGTSVYRGVSFNEKKKNWRASITVDGTSINLGDYKSEIDAAKAYNEASLKHFGPNGYRNNFRKRESRSRE